MPELIELCNLCPRMCGARRDAKRGNGYCRMGAMPVVARAALHFWEEPCISGTKGSGTVFFTGWSLQCVFCQNEQISVRREVGRALTARELSDVFFRLIEQGAHNINLVNPTHFASGIAEALRFRPLPVPVVFLFICPTTSIGILRFLSAFPERRITRNMQRKPSWRWFARPDLRLLMETACCNAGPLCGI